MVDGAALLSTAIHGLRAGGVWSDQPGTNVLDSGAHFYEVYETADGGHVAVGAIEPQFYAVLLRLLEVDQDDAPQWDTARWPTLKEQFAAIFRARTREHWAELLENADACATVVLGLGEAAAHPHNVARETFVTHDGIVQPAPAPRFSRTPAEIRDASGTPRDTLRAWGLTEDELATVELEDL
jgi:alpha-methylacyl-CoA racemase